MSFNEHFAVVDLETIGRFSDAVILSFGMTVSKYTDKDISFEQLCNSGLYCKFGLKEQKDRGRTYDDKTINWWKTKTDPEARKVLLPSKEDISIYSFPPILEKYFSDRGINIKRVDFYDRKSFDLNKIQYLCEVDCGYDTVPWSYTSEFELATAFQFRGYDRYAGVKVSDIPGALYHNALHDAAVDHIRLLKVLHEVTNE